MTTARYIAPARGTVEIKGYLDRNGDELAVLVLCTPTRVEAIESGFRGAGWTVDIDDVRDALTGEVVITTAEENTELRLLAEKSLFFGRGL